MRWNSSRARDTSILRWTALVLLSLLVAACGATAVQIIPTARPTATPTSTDAPTKTPARNVTPTVSPTPIPMTATGGPSPTPLFGAASTQVASAPTQTGGSISLNPNAPRIEFFTSDTTAAAPGTTVTLYWSTRGAREAVIYQMVRGVRNRLWNVGPDGSLPVQTSRNDRGSVDFVLSVGKDAEYTEQTLSVPLACPDVWFFQPPPEACPTAPAQDAQLIEEPFERGRMLYVSTSNQIFALFNDTLSPAWLVLDNKFDLATGQESDPDFSPPPGYYQPLRRLGFVWRGNDTVRNRLGLATQPEASYNGFTQSTGSAAGTTNTQTVYISSADGTVLQLLPQGDSWQIITPPTSP
jgi:hypothetical protein